MQAKGLKHCSQVGGLNSVVIVPALFMLVFIFLFVCFLDCTVAWMQWAFGYLFLNLFIKV